MNWVEQQATPKTPQDMYDVLHCSAMRLVPSIATDRLRYNCPNSEKAMTHTTLTSRSTGRRTLFKMFLPGRVRVEHQRFRAPLRIMLLAFGLDILYFPFSTRF